MEKDNIADLVCKLERCAEASLRRADDNAVRFETTDHASLQERRRWQKRGEKEVKVGT